MIENPSKGLISSCIEILEDLGYEVTKKEDNTDDKYDVKIYYIPYNFNKIKDIYLSNIDGITCVFLTEQGHEELNDGSDVSATEICTGYIMYYEGDDENLMIHTGSNEIPLKNFKYVTRVDDLIASLKDKESYFACSHG